MHSITRLHHIISKTFDAVSFQQQPDELYNPITYTLSQGGKRIRPLLVLLGCDLFQGKIEEAEPATLAIELFHNFTLLHDDIMDQAPLRRGKETVFKKWNTNVAILSGDTMFALACEYLSTTSPDVMPLLLKEFTRTARMVCEGQQYDMNYESSGLVHICEYLEMIRLKTAVLIGCSLKLGAIIAKAPADETDKLYTFGENIGIAFQLQDDLLDTFGDEHKFGKEIGGDILSGKKTFLLLKAFELAVTERAELEHCFSSLSIPPLEKIARVRNVFNQLKIKDITLSEIEKYYIKALQSLDAIQTEEANKTELRLFANTLLKRES